MRHRKGKWGAGRTRQDSRLRRGVLSLLGALGFIGVAAAAPWAAGVAYWHTARMPAFVVGEVRLSGLRHVRSEDLTAYVGDPTGKSVFEVEPEGMVRKLRAHPWMKDAAVRRELPGSVLITVTERVPALVAVKGDSRLLVDTEGAVLSEAAGPEWDYLPAVGYARGDGPAGPGEGPNGDLAMALELLDAARAEPSETLSGAVVYVGEDGTPYMEVEGVKVSVGRGGYGEKLRRLAEILPDVKRRIAVPRSVDLRFPGKVVVDGAKEGS